MAGIWRALSGNPQIWIQGWPPDCSARPGWRSPTPTAGPTALAALKPLGQIAAGQTVLIHAAAGGTGQAVVKMAKHYGATVIAAASPGKHETVRALGADHVLDSRSADLAAEVLRLTGGNGADLVLESVGGTTFGASLAAAKQVTGRVVVYGVVGGEAKITNWELVYKHQVHLIGLNIGMLIQAAPQIFGELMGELYALIATGVLTPGHPTVYDLADGLKALAELETRVTVGKLACCPEQPRPRVAQSSGSTTEISLRNPGGGLSQRNVNSRCSACRRRRHLTSTTLGTRWPITASAVSAWSSPASRVDGWEAELGYQAGAAAEDGDAGDARGGGGEDAESEGVMGSVAVAVVGGRGGLAVGEGGVISQSPGDPTRPGSAAARPRQIRPGRAGRRGRWRGRPGRMGRLPAPLDRLGLLAWHRRVSFLAQPACSGQFQKA